ncbi:hypothetical protein Sipo7851_14595 [Streptomyces ipomoeae]|nr:hypothetical protein Sipo7851_14595 [Streptomyces ipomoeae]
MLGALLALARRRRAPRLWPAEPPPAVVEDQAALDEMLVRAYLVPEDERTRLLATRPREAR